MTDLSKLVKRWRVRAAAQPSDRGLRSAVAEALDRCSDELLAALDAVAQPRAPLFRTGAVQLHSGSESAWKIDCDVLKDADLSTLAMLVVERLPPFGSVEGIPRGGIRLAIALQPFVTNGLPLLIVDDVLTTGGSMEVYRAGRTAMGAVLFARGDCPGWVTPVFTLSPRRLPAEPGTR